MRLVQRAGFDVHLCGFGARVGAPCRAEAPWCEREHCSLEGLRRGYALLVRILRLLEDGALEGESEPGSPRLAVTSEDSAPAEAATEGPGALLV